MREYRQSWVQQLVYSLFNMQIDPRQRRSFQPRENRGENTEPVGRIKFQMSQTYLEAVCRIKAGWWLLGSKCKIK